MGGCECAGGACECARGYKEGMREACECGRRGCDFVNGDYVGVEGGFVSVRRGHCQVGILCALAVLSHMFEAIASLVCRGNRAGLFVRINIGLMGDPWLLFSEETTRGPSLEASGL